METEENQNSRRKICPSSSFKPQIPFFLLLGRRSELLSYLIWSRFRTLITRLVKFIKKHQQVHFGFMDVHNFMLCMLHSRSVTPCPTGTLMETTNPFETSVIVPVDTASKVFHKAKYFDFFFNGSSSG